MKHLLVRCLMAMALVGGVISSGVVEAQTPQTPAPEAASATEGAAAKEAETSRVPITSGEATAAISKENAIEKGKTPRYVLGGYINPTFGVAYRPRSLPSGRVSYGSTSASLGGIDLSGSPIDKFSFVIALGLSTEAFKAISKVSLVDTDGDGVRDTLETREGAFASISFDEASVDYQFTKFLSFKAGQMRIPFTIPGRTPTAQLMFPTRAEPTEVFLAGSDRGAMLSAQALDGIIVGSFGAFTTNSLGLIKATESSRGLVYSFRLDANPLGKFGFAEGDYERGPLRIGIGGGLLYRPAELFDDAGFVSAQVRDVRMAASARMAFYGFYLQAEYLRRQRTDSFSQRPLTASGAYAQSSFYMPLSKKFSMLPIVRGGYTVEDEQTFPLRTVWFHGGFTFIPQLDQTKPHNPRFLIVYVRERRIDEGEDGHGISGQVVLNF